MHFLHLCIHTVFMQILQRLFFLLLEKVCNILAIVTELLIQAHPGPQAEW